MNYFTCSSAVLCSFLAFGCSTHSLKETQEVSVSAIAYTNSMDRLMLRTANYVIDIDSEQLLMNHQGAGNRMMLKQKDDALQKLLLEIKQFREENKDLRLYFEKLQALVDSPLKDSTSESIGRISRSLSEIDGSRQPEHMSYHPSHTLNDEQQHYIQRMSRSLVGAHYAANIKAVLMRDRMIIAKQLVRHEQWLQSILPMLNRRIKAGNMRRYTFDVLTPYVSSPNFRGSQWKTARKDWLLSIYNGEVHEDVLKANRALRKTWKDIFEGKRDVGEVRAMLVDVDEFVSSMQAFDKSRKNPYGDGVVLLSK